MKEKIMKLASVMLVIGMLVSGMGITTEAANRNMKLNKNTIKVQVENSVKLKVKNKSKKYKVTWKSKDKSIATVSKTGKVKGCNVGSTKIICTVKRGHKKVNLICKVKVENNSQDILQPSDINSTETIPTPTLSVEEQNTLKPTESNAKHVTPAPESYPVSMVNDTTGGTSDGTVAVSTGKSVVKVGMTISELEEAMGSAAYILPSEYEGCSWYVYNADYEKFAMVLVNNREVVGVYADGKTFSYGSINSDTTVSALTNVGFASNSYMETYYKTVDNITVNAYVDELGDNTVEGILVMNKMSSAIKSDTCKTYEKISFELTNAFRVKNGLPAFTWNEQVADVARAHSKDMRDNNYFNHTSLTGAGPGDRLKNAGLGFMAYAENIAMGYENGIEVTYGWINSSGHRSNMLFEAVTELGVGVESDCTYYTQVFYKGR